MSKETFEAVDKDKAIIGVIKCHHNTINQLQAQIRKLEEQIPEWPRPLNSALVCCCGISINTNCPIHGRKED